MIQQTQIVKALDIEDLAYTKYDQAHILSLAALSENK